jgi:hypothetical protein
VANTGAQIVGEVVHVMQHGVYMLFDVELATTAVSDNGAFSTKGSHHQDNVLAPSTAAHHSSLQSDIGSPQSGVVLDHTLITNPLPNHLAGGASVVQNTSAAANTKQVVSVLGYIPDVQLLRSIKGISDPRNLEASFKVISCQCWFLKYV